MSDDPSDGGAPLFSSLPGAEERVMSTRKTGSVVAGWVAAVVIGVSVVLAMGRVVMDKSEMARAEAAEGGTRVSRMEAEMGARYLVGMNEIVGPVLVAGGESKERWLWTVAEAAQYARQRVSLVILRWEILGDEALAADFPVVFGDEDDRLDWETLAVIRRAAAVGGVGGGRAVGRRSCAVSGEVRMGRAIGAQPGVAGGRTLAAGGAGGGAAHISGECDAGVRGAGGLCAWEWAGPLGVGATGDRAVGVAV